MSNILLRPSRIGEACLKIQAASTTGLTMVKSDEQGTTERPHKFIFRWGTQAVAQNYDDSTVVVNTAKAVSWCTDKRQGRLDMQAAGVPVPQTWGDLRGFIRDNRDMTSAKTYVVRPLEHERGQSYFVGNALGAAGQLADLGSGYVSEHIDKVAEYRVNVVQGRVAQVGSKSLTDSEQTSWGGSADRFNNVRWGSWPMAVVAAAVAAARAGKLDFCGVDVMVDAEGKAYVLECNSAPWLGDYGGWCMAKCFDYIVENGKAALPAVPFNTWRDAIHPAVVGADSYA